MRRDQLEHLIRAAGDVLGTDEVIVVGSQAVLASVPSGLPVEAVRSVEADILPLNDPEETKADLIDGALGEASRFQETHGIYAQGVGQRSARLPRGWRERLVPLRNENTAGVTGWCLEPEDLCVSKLVAGRPKDIEFCAALIAAHVVGSDMLLGRLEETDATPDEKRRIKSTVEALTRRAGLEPERQPDLGPEMDM